MNRSKRDHDCGRRLAWCVVVVGLAPALASGQDTNEPASTADEPSRWVTQQPQVMPTLVTGADPTKPSREAFHVSPGFQVERLFEVPKETHGSWVSLAFDAARTPVGLRPGPAGFESRDHATDWQRRTDAGGTVGVADHRRPRHAVSPSTASMSRQRRTGQRVVSSSGLNQDGELDQVEKLHEFRGGGEHGPHAIRLSPDGKSLYVVCGNHTDPPDFDASRLLPQWGEDLLLPRQWDARGHARGRLAPGGWIARTDPEGTPMGNCQHRLPQHLRL